MVRLSLGLAALLAVPALLLIGAGLSGAQTVVVSPPPTVTYYTPPPTVTYYTPPVAYYAPPPTVTYYTPPVVYNAAPAYVTTYRYGIFGKRVVARTYAVAPAAPVNYYAAPAVTYYGPVVAPRRAVVRYYYP
jgi:hypothetical protein